MSEHFEQPNIAQQTTVGVHQWRRGLPGPGHQANRVGQRGLRRNRAHANHHLARSAPRTPCGAQHRPRIHVSHRRPQPLRDDQCHQVRIQRLLSNAAKKVILGIDDKDRAGTAIAGDWALDLTGATTLAELAAVLDGSSVVVAPNTGPAHLAAAVGTPVVSLFAPVVPASSWAPYRVPTVLLGDQGAPCRATRARTCPVPGHPCLNDVAPHDVVDAVEHLLLYAPKWPAADLVATFEPTGGGA